MKKFIDYIKNIYQKKSSSHIFDRIIESGTNNNSLTTIKDSLNAYTSFVYVSICCDMICRDVTKNDYYFCDNVGNRIENEKIPEIILLPFSNNIVRESFLDTLKLVVYHMLLTGNGYLKKDKKSLYGSYKDSYDGFTVIFPYEIKPILSDNQKELLKYEIRYVNSDSEIVDPSEIIHFKQNAIFNQYVGVGNITKMRLLAEGELASQVFNNEFMNNKAFPSVIFSDESPIRPGDYDRNFDLIQRRFKAANGKAFYVNGTNFKIHQLNPSYQDMQFLEQKKYNQEAIYELFGCYKLDDTTNRATAEIKRLKYLENTINSIINNIENTINHQYVFNMVDNKEINFKIDRYKTTDVENIIKMLTNGIITPNRASQLLGEEILPDNFERNSFYMPLNLVPINSINNDVSSEENKKQIIKKNTNLNDPKNINEIATYVFKNSSKNKWFQIKFLKRALHTRNNIEHKYVFILKRFFKRQRKRIEKKIELNFDKFKSIKFDKKDNIEDLENNFNILFSIKNEDKILKKYIYDLHEETLNRSIEDINYLVNTNIEPNSNIMNYLKNSLGSRIIGDAADQNINKFTQKKVYNVIINSLNNNLTINEIKYEMDKLFTSFEGYRTRTIARTESRIAWDAAAVETYKDLDVKKVDVVGCTQFEIDSDCGKKGILLTEVLGLRFHPNHIGALAPEIEP